MLDLEASFGGTVDSDGGDNQRFMVFGFLIRRASSRENRGFRLAAKRKTVNDVSRTRRRIIWTLASRSEAFVK
jgi:hypothetical protein